VKSIPRAGVYLDTRRKYQNGKYPVKIRVSFRRITHNYKTGISLTEDAFKKSFEAKSPHGQAYLMKEEIQGHLKKAEVIIKGLNTFSFGEFERAFYDVRHADQDLFSLYDQVIEENKAKGSFSNSEFYRLSKAKLIHYFAGSQSVPFDRIDSGELAKIDKWLRNKGLGNTSISIYFRCLKHIYYIALKKGFIGQNQNPFNSQAINPYRIPSSRNVKRPLNVEQLKSLLAYNPISGSPKEEARDFWLLSLYCNGMNINDLLQLKNNSYRDSKIIFTRGKTMSKTSHTLKINVSVVQHAAQLIEKYRNEDHSPEAYLFPVLEGVSNDEEQRKRIKNFTKKINQHMKKIAQEIGLPTGISTYWARYTFTNLAKNRGASTEFIQESVGHTSKRTTEIYLDSFEDSIREETTLKIFEGL